MQVFVLSSTNGLAARLNGLGETLEAVAVADLAALRSECSGRGVVVVESEADTAELRATLRTLKQEFRQMAVVVVLGTAKAGEIVKLVKAGADHVHAGAVDGEFLEALQEFETAAAPAAVADEQPWKRILIGDSWPMQVVGHMIRLVGPRNATVLISGDTGTGKEVVARAIHLASNRVQGPMVCLNCAALPQDLLEAELFGHTKGAFTGAVSHRVGLIEQANKGTLFLDEIGEMPLNLQAKLLRVLQEREFQRLGSGETVKVDIRVIAATNVDLPKKVKEGRFREDLYYRLRVVPVQLTPLRERREDIPQLVEHFIAKTCQLEQMELKRASAEVMQALMEYEWPGNVRELENSVAMAVALSADRDTLEIWDFPVLMAPAEVQAPMCLLPPKGIDFEKVVTQFRRSLLEQALRSTAWNKTQAAQMLGLKRTTLTAALRSLNLCRDEEENSEEGSLLTAVAC